MRRIRTLFDLLLEAARSFGQDRASSMGAALAYYTMLSIAPTVLIVVSVAGLVFGEEAARTEVVEQLRLLVGDNGANAVEALLARANRPASGIIGTVGGLIAMVIGATTVFSELQASLDKVWRVPAQPKASGIMGFVRTRLLSLSLVLSLGFLVMVSLLASAALAALQRWWLPLVGSFAWIARYADFITSFLMVTAAFAIIYKAMPRVRIEWRDVWVGAILTALLFTIGKTLIGAYLGTSGVASPFGAAASLVAFVIWVYWSTQIFLFGAELTRVYAERMGRFPPRD
ncbi:MAG: YihY/virulence factor BrkB family protein [Burkholderiaceae bacterium]|jgi:membrane protein|nr:YihY/virulence factor BrkB family protein [Burkholderiaceae bacterium]MEB2319899.1 YihY/virulence factor BrkB family protein [Pseudomonadota bacterium]